MTIYARIAAVLALLGLLFAAYWTIDRRGYNRGANEVRAEWNAEKLAAEIQAENNRLLAQANINRIDTAGAVKAQKQSRIDQSIIEKVEINVPNTLPMLPGSFRVQHDAAATGQEIDRAGAADADPVAPRTVARTLTRNYADARSDKQNLEELQAIVRASGCFEVE